MALKPQQAKFVTEYVKDWNATQAAIRAGYSERTAQEQSSRLLSNVMVQEAIQDQLDAQQARTLITADRILREYGRIGFLDTRKLFDENGALKKITELDIDTQAAIAGIDVVTTGNAELGVGEITKIRIADRKGALDSMARCLMMFNDKKTVSVDEPLAQLLSMITSSNSDVLSRVRDDDGDSDTD